MHTSPKQSILQTAWILILVISTSLTLHAQLRITQPTATTPIQGGSDVEIRWVNDAPPAVVE
jgi:hypothetical protein